MLEFRESYRLLNQKYIESYYSLSYHNHRSDNYTNIYKSWTYQNNKGWYRVNNIKFVEKCLKMPYCTSVGYFNINDTKLFCSFNDEGEFYFNKSEEYLSLIHI